MAGGVAHAPGIMKYAELAHATQNAEGSMNATCKGVATGSSLMAVGDVLLASLSGTDYDWLAVVLQGCAVYGLHSCFALVPVANWV